HARSTWLNCQCLTRLTFSTCDTVTAPSAPKWICNSPCGRGKHAGCIAHRNTCTTSIATTNASEVLRTAISPASLAWQVQHARALLHQNWQGQGLAVHE